MISILAPYGRNEVTLAAIRLAEFATGCGHDVRLIACGQHEQKVHPAWDGQVKSAKKLGIPKAVFGATTVVHFQCHHFWLQAATLADTVLRRAKQILVPTLHGFHKTSVEAVPRYDQIICPSVSTRNILFEQAFLGDRTEGAKLKVTKWTAALPPVRREGTVEGGRIRASVYCDASAIDFCGPLVLETIDRALQNHPHLIVTVLSTKSWCTRDRSTLAHLAHKWPDRLERQKVTNLFDLNRAFLSSDWAMVPGVRAEFGTAAATAMACGTVVVCNNVAPFSEIVTNARGLLVPCEVSKAAYGPIAIPSLAAWGEAADKAFSAKKLLLSLQTQDWHLQQTAAAFNKVWAEALV